MIMDKLWIISLILSTAHKTNGQSNVEVNLLAKKYVERGSNVTLYCEHNVDWEILYKVAWLKSSEHKFFEYISNRDPPYRNFSLPGADIDFSKSNATQVTLMNVDFDASGNYFCEVSIDNPIFTKASAEEHLQVIVKQTGPPKILFKKKLFVVGENLIANCTTTRAKPHPHITWQINGKKVDDIYTTTLHPHIYRSKSHQSSNNNVQQSTQNKSDFNDIRGTIYGKITNPAQESRDYESSPNFNETDYNHFQPHVRSGYGGYRADGARYRYGNVITQIDGDQFDYGDDRNRETDRHFYDNKYGGHYRMHGNALETLHKMRRHLNGEARTITNSMKKVKNFPTYSSSQLSIKVSDLHADKYGRLEITCLSTIPAKVRGDDLFADFKSYSVKIDVKAAETTTVPSPTVGMAALGGSGRTQHPFKIFNFIMFVVSQCLPFSIFYSFLSM